MINSAANKVTLTSVCWSKALPLLSLFFYQVYVAGSFRTDRRYSCTCFVTTIPGSPETVAVSWAQTSLVNLLLPRPSWSIMWLQRAHFQRPQVEGLGGFRALTSPLTEDHWYSLRTYPSIPFDATLTKTWHLQNFYCTVFQPFVGLTFYTFPQEACHGFPYSLAYSPNAHTFFFYPSFKNANISFFRKLQTGVAVIAVLTGILLLTLAIVLVCYCRRLKKGVADMEQLVDASAQSGTIHH